MSDWQPVARLSEIPAGSGIEVEWQGRLVALFHVDGRVVAVDGACPHQGGPLADGDLEGCVVVCPWHRWKFDLATGRNLHDPAKQLTSYEVRVERDVVFLSWP